MSAINQLVGNSGDGSRYSGYLKDYTVNGQKIIHFYDPPHLLKGIRNNLLVKNLVWESSNGETLCATWENITHAYETDNCSGDLRAVPKLTQCHIYASFINILSKMPSEKIKQNRHWARLKF
jgi:hypothetical protein